jgi:hypothetical protein
VAIIFAKYHSEFGIDYDFSKALLSESKSSFNFCAQGPTTATADQVEFLSNHELSTEFDAMQTLSVFNNPFILKFIIIL